MTDIDPGIRIILEGLSEEKVRQALGFAGLKVYTLEVVPIPEQQNTEPVLGYASYGDLANFLEEQSKAGYSASRIHTRLWNALVRIGGLASYSQLTEDKKGKVQIGETELELFKSTGFTSRSPEVGPSTRGRVIGYLLNLDTLNLMIESGLLEEVPNLGVVTAQFAKEFVDKQKQNTQPLES